MEVSLPPGEEDLVETAIRFAREEVRSHAAGWERDRHVPVEAMRRGIGHGLTALRVPKDKGGHGASVAAVARVMEEIAAADLAFGFAMVVQTNVTAAVANRGSPEQIARFLPGLLAGESIGAFCLTEPEVGSDAAAIATRAERADGGWRITGEKAWVTNGAVANLFWVFAQTNPAAGSRGIAAFLVEGGAPGIAVQPLEEMLGGHAIGVNRVSFQGCLVPEVAMLAAPGAGFKAAMQGIDFARTVLSAMCCGILRDSLDCVLAYAAERQAFGRPVAGFQGLQWQLADVATDLEAARLLTYEAARLLDSGGRATAAAAHAKKFSSRAALAGIVQCMQAMGAAGLRSEWPFGRHLAGAKIAQYLDGTTEIQNVVLSRALLEPYGIR